MPHNVQKTTEMAFDWYQCTIQDGSADEVIASILSHYELSSVRSINGQNSYLNGALIYRGDNKIARVYWGGVNGDDPHVISTSHEAVGISSFLRSWYPDHRVTRVDVCEDYTGDGTFDLIYAALEAFALKKNLQLKQIGDYTRGVNGRTLYVGSPSSVVYLRLYEKGIESGHPDKNWTRLEITVRPKKSTAREYFSKAPPVAFFGASAWSTELFTLLTALTVPRVVAGTVRVPTDDERSYNHMIKQYGPLLSRILTMHGEDYMKTKIINDIIKHCQTEE